MLFRLSLFVVALSGATGFVPPAAHKRAATKAFNAAADSKSTPFEPVDLDVERAKDCAEHFGKCSIEELEHLKASK